MSCRALSAAARFSQHAPSPRWGRSCLWTTQASRFPRHRRQPQKAFRHWGQSGPCL